MYVVRTSHLLPVVVLGNERNGENKTYFVEMVGSYIMPRFFFPFAPDCKTFFFLVGVGPAANVRATFL